MGTVVWIIRGFVVITFFYSGFCKSLYTEQKLINMGQTGVEGLPTALIRFIGISELAGILALLLATFFPGFKIAGRVAAFCLGAIMLPAAVIHFKRKELKSVLINFILLCSCLFLGFLN